MCRTFSNVILTGFLLCVFIVNAQDRQKREFGVLDVRDQNVTSYAQDPEAAGVVLFERGKNYVKVIRNYVRLVKFVHVRMKVFDASEFTRNSVQIPYYRGSSEEEVVNNLKAITHNGEVKTYLSENDIFTVDETENWSYKKFTFPNVKDGSILEYTYRIESPYFFNFGGWEFQSEIPKLYSEFGSEIPGNYIYRKALIGTEKLDINEVYLEKDCFWIESFAQNADCEVGIYAMIDVPAFKDEDYMLASSNYRARISYELQEHINFDGIKTKYTKEWKDVDKEFRTNKELGRQLAHKNFFKNQLPPEDLANPNELERAKAVFYFIQDHYSWNGKRGIFSDVNIRKAFDNKSGNSSEINLSLINALNAAEITSKIVLLSTRDNGIPTQLYPVLTEFNYVVAQVKIGEEIFLLDATDKYTSFGALPLRGLNSIGRLLDFKSGSKWVNLAPFGKNLKNISAQLQIDEDLSITGKVREIFTGHLAAYQRNLISGLSEEDYIKGYKATAEGLSVRNFDMKNFKDFEKSLTETYEIRFEPEKIGNDILIYPFFGKGFYSENPFKLESRDYPVDFGYPFIKSYSMSIDLQGLYKVKELPTGKIVKLPENAGECSVYYSESNGTIVVRFKLQVNDYHFAPHEYNSLKDFFSTVVEWQSKEVILLEKL